MKYSVFLLSFIVFNPLVTSAQDSLGYGKIYFIREPSGVPGQSALQIALNYFKVFIDNTFVCSLNEQKFSVHQIFAGKHTIRVYARNTNPKRESHDKIVNVQAGKTYYIALDFRGYRAPTPVVIHPLTEDLAQMILPSLKQDKSCSGKE